VCIQKTVGYLARFGRTVFSAEASVMKEYILRKGIKIEAEEEGSGEIALKDSTVRIRYNLALSKGDVVQKGIVLTFDLFRRRVVAGLRYGVEGMRVGGRRRVRVSPHLGYGERGWGEEIPANAVLIFDVELLAVISYPDSDK